MQLLEHYGLGFYKHGWYDRFRYSASQGTFSVCSSCKLICPQASAIANSCKSLIDDIINSMNHLGYKVIEAVEQGLLRAPLSDLGFTPSSVGEADQRGENQVLEEKAKLEIENGVHQFETLIEATIDKNFDKLEVVALRSILAIPEELRDWVRLRDYEVTFFPLWPCDMRSELTKFNPGPQLRYTA
jgi:hypothetical protein